MLQSIYDCLKIFYPFNNNKDNEIDSDSDSDSFTDSDTDICTNNKKALLIGINYTNTSHALQGCINDITFMKDFLKRNDIYDIHILSDVSDEKPTRHNILTNLNNLVFEATNNDTVFIHFSGHGTYTKDYNSDEIDKKDECLYCIDDKIITDDEIHNIFTNFHENVRVICLFDCCHSGTIADLQYSYLENFKQRINNDKKIKSSIIAISGCMDYQTSSDAFIDKSFQGAMTSAFLSSYTKNITLVNLVDNMRSYLQLNNFSQYPILSSSFPITNETTLF